MGVRVDRRRTCRESVECGRGCETGEKKSAEEEEEEGTIRFRHSGLSPDFPEIG